MKPQLLFSLHDVTPFHFKRLEKAETWFRRWGVSKVTYLFVPNYHGYGEIYQPEFVDWCARERPFDVEWALHGYYHLERRRKLRGGFSPGRLKDWYRRRFLTQGEGEFLSLGAEESATRIGQGLEVFRSCLPQVEPVGFVPPAWLHNKNLFPALAAVEGADFRFTENHRYIYQLKHKRKVKSPVVTWATRTWLRRKGSLVVCPRLYENARKAQVLRIAVHPFDFDFPETRESIEALVMRALKEREPADYASVCS